jgi:hypothetical protein
MIDLVLLQKTDGNAGEQPSLGETGQNYFDRKKQPKKRQCVFLKKSGP